MLQTNLVVHADDLSNSLDTPSLLVMYEGSSPSNVSLELRKGKTFNSSISVEERF